MSGMIAIVGRPNVGKSTLFNRLVGMRQAIVDEFSGVTRDRHYGKTFWNGREFSVIDTGGYVEGSDDIFEEEIRKQVLLAIEEADLILFTVDTNEGVHPLDEEFARVLRQTKKPVLLVANKADNPGMSFNSSEFYVLGIDRLYPLSAVNGSGTGDILDDIVKALPPDTDNKDIENPELPRIAVVGRPNAGKSSFINALLGVERNIVTDIAGTTRDSIDTRFNAFGFDFYLVDTAGVRKKSKVHEDLEFYSVMRSIRAIEHSDVCILMVDAHEGFAVQDVNIFSLIQKNKKGVVVVINKWDLIEKETNTSRDLEKYIRERISPFTDVEIIFTSVNQKQRLLKALEAAIRAFENRKKKIKTSELNEVLLPIIEHTPPPATKGKHIKIKYITQLPTPTPAFVFFANLPQYIKDPYARFLENKLREAFDFKGTPVQVFFRKK